MCLKKLELFEFYHCQNLHQNLKNVRKFNILIGKVKLLLKTADNELTK